MYTCPLGLHMAKLYWRVKKNGKWTWKPAESMDDVPLGAKYTTVYNLDLSELEDKS